MGILDTFRKKKPSPDRLLKSYEIWETAKLGSHENGKIGGKFAAPQYGESPGSNFAAAVRKITNKRKGEISPYDLADIYRNDSEAFSHLAEIETGTPDGMISHLDQLRHFARSHFSNPENMPYLMGMISVSMEKFGGKEAFGGEKQKGLKIPKSIISEEHKEAIRNIPEPFDAFLADELRHIYNESWRTMGHTLEKNDIHILGFHKQSKIKAKDELAFCDMARTKELAEALKVAERFMQGRSYNAVSIESENKRRGAEETEEEFHLRGLKERGHMNKHELRDMSNALKENKHLNENERRMAEQGYLLHSHTVMFGGLGRSPVPIDVVKVHTVLHTALRPFIDAKLRSEYYPKGKMPSLEEAYKMDKAQENHRPSSGPTRGEGVTPGSAKENKQPDHAPPARQDSDPDLGKKNSSNGFDEPLPQEPVRESHSTPEEADMAEAFAASRNDGDFDHSETSSAPHAEPPVKEDPKVQIQDAVPANPPEEAKEDPRATLAPSESSQKPPYLSIQGLGKRPAADQTNPLPGEEKPLQREAAKTPGITPAPDVKDSDLHDRF